MLNVVAQSKNNLETSKTLLNICDADSEMSK
jgi:hypothetical protein